MAQKTSFVNNAIIISKVNIYICTYVLFFTDINFELIILERNISFIYLDEKFPNTDGERFSETHVVVSSGTRWHEEKSCASPAGQMSTTSRRARARERASGRAHYSRTNCPRIIFVPRETSIRAARRAATLVISRAQTCLSQPSRWECCNLQADITAASCLPLHLSS